jgi:hypothetical protein
MALSAVARTALAISASSRLQVVHKLMVVLR